MCQGKIRPGYRFGSLTVMEKTEKRKNDYIVWRCMCDCGNEVLMDTRLIQRETRTHCGCQNFDLSLKNRKIGSYTVLEPARVEHYTCYWRCQCECGEVFETSQENILKGRIHLCPDCQGKYRDLQGRQFGELTVLERAENFDGQIQWRCRCSCGNEITVSQSTLLRGKKKSCGCLQAQMGKKNLRLCEGTSISKLESCSRKPIASNTSGHTGIYQIKRNGKWGAQITFKNKTYYLGTYSTLEEAIEARKEGEKIHLDFLNRYYELQSAETG